MSTSTTKKAGIFGGTLLVSGFIGIMLTVGGGVMSQEVPIWQKIGNRVEIFPRDTQLVVDRVEMGGGKLATSTDATTFGTLSESQLETNSLIEFTPNTGSATTTIAATSTWDTLIPNVGDHFFTTLYNATGTPSTTVGIAAGTGIVLTSDTFENVQIPAGGSATMLCTRLATGGDVLCDVDINPAGD